MNIITVLNIPFGGSRYTVVSATASGPAVGVAKLPTLPVRRTERDTD